MNRVIKKRNLFLTVLKAGSPRSRWYLVRRAHFLVHHGDFLPCSHTAEG
jgi:hypothetical protein